MKSSWIPPIQRSVALETYLGEVKIKLAETPLVKPKNNLPTGEQRALKELINNKEIILKKADKSTTTVVMSRENKINEGQIQLNDRNNYQQEKMSGQRGRLKALAGICYVHESYF